MKLVNLMSYMNLFLVLNWFIGLYVFFVIESYKLIYVGKLVVFCFNYCLFDMFLCWS